jgi:hypothetical protein
MVEFTMRGFLIVSQLLIVLGSGGPAGIAWLNAFVNRGVYSDRCTEDGGVAPCDAQVYAIAQATMLCLAMGPFAAWPAGIATNIFHPVSVLTVALALYAIPTGLRGVMSSDGTVFVVTGLISALTVFVLITIVQGRLLPLCTKNEKERDGLVGRATVMGLIGAAASAPLSLFINWTALPLWVELAVIATLTGGVLIAWHFHAVVPKRQLFSKGMMTPAEIMNATRQVLTNRWVLHGILWRSVVHGVTRAVEASVNVIAAKHFHTSPDAQTYSPFVGAVGGVIFLFFDRLGITEYPRLQLALRIFLLLATLVLWVLPQARNGVCFYLGLLAMLTYRAHIAVQMKRNTLAAFAHRRHVCGQAMGYLQTAASVASAGVGAVSTHLFHRGGPTAVSWVVIAAVAGAMIFELPIAIMVIFGRRIIDSAPPSPGTATPSPLRRGQKQQGTPYRTTMCDEHEKMAPLAREMRP